MRLAWRLDGSRRAPRSPGGLMSIGVVTARLRSVWLVMADEDRRRALTGTLEQQETGWRVTQLSDLRQVERAVVEERPELVLLEGEPRELGMLLPRLEESGAGAVVVTATRDPALERALLRAGAQEVLSRDELQGARLGRALEAALERTLHRREREQLAAQQLGRARRDLDERVAEAAHDLQEPARTMRRLAERLLTRSSAQLDARGREYLSRITSSAGRMESMVREVLTLRRMAGAPVGARRVALGPLLEEVRADLTGALDETGGRLEVEPLPTVLGDATQLRRLFSNLLGNALKFVHPERIPHLSVRATRRERGRIAIEIQDNGLGFAARGGRASFLPLDRQFGHAQGMGLGICQAIARAHGGELTATSSPGQGALLTLVLPLARGESPDAAPPSYAHSHRSRCGSWLESA